jgi:hypothetical protein
MFFVSFYMCFGRKGKQLCLSRFEYDLLATFLVEKRGYDPSIKHKDFDSDSHLICKVFSELIT